MIVQKNQVLVSSLPTVPPLVLSTIFIFLLSGKFSFSEIYFFFFKVLMMLRYWISCILIFSSKLLLSCSILSFTYFILTFKSIFYDSNFSISFSSFVQANTFNSLFYKIEESTFPIYDQYEKTRLFKITVNYEARKLSNLSLKSLSIN